jgi:hypothetical protein
MVGKLMKHLGMGAIIVAATVVAIYFTDYKTIQDFLNASFKLPNGLLLGIK